MTDEEIRQENEKLVGKRFVNTHISGHPICVVLGVDEGFPFDVVFETEDPAYTTTGPFRYVEFASFVQEHLVVQGIVQ